MRFFRYLTLCLHLASKERKSQPVSATHLFGDNLNARLKELDGTNKFSLSKKTYIYRKDKKQRCGSRGFSAGLLKNTSRSTATPKREAADKSEKRPERKVGAKAPVNAVTKLSASNSDINYQKYLSFNLENTPGNFMAVKTEWYREQWCSITSDRWILNTVSVIK